jgi:hypothetical protein
MKSHICGPDTVALESNNEREVMILMDMDQYYRSLPDRIKDEFIEIDSDICTNLRKQDEDYAALFQESSGLQTRYPIIMKVIGGGGAISLTAEEHAALVLFLEVKWGMENAERQQIYFRGHTDNFAYLKSIGAL